jgi:hypothetical protein
LLRCASMVISQKTLECVYRNQDTGQIGCWGFFELNKCTCSNSFCEKGSQCPN